ECCRNAPNVVRRKRAPSLLPEPIPRHPRWLYPLAIVALGSGLRRGTITKMTWACVDFSRERWQIPAGLMKVPQAYTAPISQRVLSALRDWRAESLSREGPASVARDAPVFNVGPNGASRAFRMAARRAGVNCSLH